MGASLVAMRARYLHCTKKAPSLRPPSKWAEVELRGLEGFPFEPAFGTFESTEDVVITGIPGTGIGLGAGHLVVDVGVLVAQTPATGGAGPAGFLFTKPTFHR
jgi:hypothetical protein